MAPAPPVSLTKRQLDDIQGDIWSKGFPKDYETYYFFSVVEAKRKEFAKCLKQLVDHEPPLLSTLSMVSGYRTDIRKNKLAFEEAKSAGTVEKDAARPRVDMSNALIAFTYKGLQTLQGGPDADDILDLDDVKTTDELFAEGMSNDWKTKDRKTMNDPKLEKWDTLFQSPDKIHGLLKIAGSDKKQVEDHLKEIQTLLLHGTAIVDVPGDSPPTMASSRVDGHTRPGHRGKEHFGYEDGISQPLMDGIDVLEPPTGDPTRTNMNTLPHILIVSEHTKRESEKKRPAWMNNGSFLVLRKLQQNVKAFEELVDKWETVNCDSKAQMGAKLMGRYRNGAPIAVPEHRQQDSMDPKTVNKDNNFGFKDEACPFSAHIRKTNLRVPLGANDSDPRARRTRVIRSGISYGSEYEGNEDDESRGLLFACYQGQIKDGFWNMQTNWSNNPAFREGDPGHDPIIGQVAQTPSGDNGELETVLTDKTHQAKKRIRFPQLVTMKGGEYFFVPSFPALRGKLAEV